MADQLYGYKSIYGAAAASSKVGLGLSLGLGSGPGPGPGLGVAAPTSSRYNRLGSPEASYLSPSSSSLYLPKSIKKKNDPFSYSTSDIGAYSWDNASEYDPMASGIKRSSHALYHPSMYGAQNTTVQSEAWYTTDSLSKRTRVESASNLPIYPQRPGEKDCAHYMLTRTCKFGNSCKFDHPIWVPEGGIPDWKEVPLLATTESFPERLGEPDCPYFLKTQRCKFGLRCKFNHPKYCTTLSAPENYASATLPERPSEPPCAFYMKNGICKFGATCKFHHPHDINPLETDQDNGDGKQNDSLEKSEGTIGDVKLVKPFSSFSFSPALLHNSKGLPIRPGEVDCPFYVKTGSCKYGATCRYNHPGRNTVDPPATAMGALLANTAGNADISVAPIASIYETIKPSFSPVMFGVSHGTYPQRPGQAECDYYMKTGACKFGERCKFHHPVDRLAQTSLTKQSQQSVRLTLAGLPRREGTIFCPYYLKTGTCKFGATCKFDHPPPGEVMTMAASQGASVTAEAEAKE